jgi:hypothetical protein
MLDQPTSTTALGCLLMTLAGTVLASWQEPTFCALSAALMFTVNTCLTFRNAATKRILRGFPDAAAAQAAGLDAGGAAGAGAGEGAEKGGPDGKLGGCLDAPPEPPPPLCAPPGAVSSVSSASTASFHAPEVLSCAVLALTNVAGLAGTLALWGGHALHDAGVLQRIGLGAEDATQSGTVDAALALPLDAWRLLLVVGGSNFMYNVASQL